MRPDEATAQEAPSLDQAEMLAAMKRGVAAALRKHRDAGVPAVHWDAEAGQVAETPADRMPTWIDDPSLDP